MMTEERLKAIRERVSLTTNNSGLSLEYGWFDAVGDCSVLLAEVSTLVHQLAERDQQIAALTQERDEINGEWAGALLKIGFLNKELTTLREGLEQLASRWEQNSEQGESPYYRTLANQLRAVCQPLS